MQNTKSAPVGLKPTKYKCYLGFYDLTEIQGKPVGWLIKLTGFSNVTHVGPIIETHTQGNLCVTICAGRTVNNRRMSFAKTHSEETLSKLGGKLIAKTYIGEFDLNLEQVVLEARAYTDASPWDIVFHQFVGRFLGLTRPRACSSFVCRLFGLPDTWHPATLWRLYADNSTSGTSQGRKDNRSNVHS
jgi:hypothetical protein